MGKWLRVLAIVTTTAMSACGASADGPPEIVVDRTACAQCGMLVSELAFAAAYRVPGRPARAFDDIGCLLDALAQEPQRTDVQLWFRDAADAQRIEGRQATFVQSPELRTPMGGGIAAYRDRDAAARTAVQHHGRVVATFADLLGRRGRS